MQTHQLDKAIIAARNYCGIIKNYAPFDFTKKESIDLVGRFIEILEKDEGEDEKMHKCSAYALLGLSKPAIKSASSRLSQKVLSSISTEAVNQLVEGYVLKTAPIIYVFPGDLIDIILLLPNSENYIAKASERLRQAIESNPEKKDNAEEIQRYLTEKSIGFLEQRLQYIRDLKD